MPETRNLFGDRVFEPIIVEPEIGLTLSDRIHICRHDVVSLWPAYCPFCKECAES